MVLEDGDEVAQGFAQGLHRVAFAALPPARDPAERATASYPDGRQVAMHVGVVREPGDDEVPLDFVIENLPLTITLDRLRAVALDLALTKIAITAESGQVVMDGPDADPCVARRSRPDDAPLLQRGGG